jgi:hypothetical protein
MEVAAYRYGSWHNFSHCRNFLELDAYRQESYRFCGGGVAVATSSFCGGGFAAATSSCWGVGAVTSMVVGVNFQEIVAVGRKLPGNRGVRLKLKPKGAHENFLSFFTCGRKISARFMQF